MHLSVGQLGRVAVIGGSQDYTGAPYFSAMASARLGCDMVCEASFRAFRSTSTPPTYRAYQELQVTSLGY